MTINGKLICTTPFNDKVYGTLTRDLCSRRVSVNLLVEYASGAMSDIITLSRKDIISKRDCFDIFFDLEGDFSRDDIDKIKRSVMDLISQNVHRYMDTENKAPITKIYETIVEYIRTNAEELKDNADADCFIKGDYGYLRTSCMDPFVKEHPELGFKRLDILKRLKMINVLAVGKGRTYDILVGISGKKVHFFKILLPDTGNKEETADEEIEIK